MTASATSGRAGEKGALRKKSPSPRNQHGIQGVSKEANRIVVAILEVLGGLRSPAEAAESLKISLPRYYILEVRALEGMVAACEPKPLGKQPSPETRIASLEKELQQAHRQCARQQALVRAAQRSVGLSAADTQKGTTSSKRDRKGRKKRRPTVRALKAAETLRSRVVSAEASEVQQTDPNELAIASTQVGPGEAQGVASC
jgi:hypothetical protein